MQFHPHGDASIGDALVQLGQKDLLIDCQGNWGNIRDSKGFVVQLVDFRTYFYGSATFAIVVFGSLPANTSTNG